ncbi:uncharacterized protein LOC128998990 [Macrosteles quadrilineatus]|uniref:uncharacterized protein LOC128998990 n=1 Tax=Macrosteles quadrilineatus TaxID=74068 RepID=UPI0023E2D42C|nr:uncharacterized protein LOC128998990 [Macrosteles quadrilineatus]
MGKSLVYWRLVQKQLFDEWKSKQMRIPGLSGLIQNRLFPTTECRAIYRNIKRCPVDQEIMGMFHYSSNMTTALVHFQAHKFPYTASVYYQCNVRLCLKADDGCGDVPPPCNDERRRRKRNDDDGEGSPATIEVYSGLYVNEANELGVPDQLDLVNREKALDDPDNICISQRNFAIAIAVAGLILMLMVVAAFIILLARRRSRKEISTTGSSIYSGPYTNTAYSHSS